jgi:hypothetical protein
LLQPRLGESSDTPLASACGVESVERASSLLLLVLYKAFSEANAFIVWAFGGDLNPTLSKILAVTSAGISITLGTLGGPDPEPNVDEPPLILSWTSSTPAKKPDTDTLRGVEDRGVELFETSADIFDGILTSDEVLAFVSALLSMDLPSALGDDIINEEIFPALCLLWDNGVILSTLMALVTEGEGWGVELADDDLGDVLATNAVILAGIWTDGSDKPKSISLPKNLLLLLPVLRGLPAFRKVEDLGRFLGADWGDDIVDVVLPPYELAGEDNADDGDGMTGTSEEKEALLVADLPVELALGDCMSTPLLVGVISSGYSSSTS